MIKAVIIDLDDTFSLTEVTSFKMENDILQQMGRAPMSHEVHLKTWEQTPLEAILVRSPGIDIEVFKTIYQPLLAEYVASGKLDTIPETNYKALDELAAQNKMLLVLTSRTHDRMQHMLQPEHLLATKIKAFYHRGNTRFRKPDPRVFNELLKNTGLLPEECVYVGDSIYDAMAAKKAGLYFIASLESGLRHREDFDGYLVDMFIDRFSDIVSAIKCLESSFPIAKLS